MAKRVDCAAAEAAGAAAGLDRLALLERLTQNLAHELSNQLSPLLVLSRELLEEAPAGDEHRVLYQELYASAVRAKDHVRRLSLLQYRRERLRQTVYLDQLLLDFKETLSALLGDSGQIRISPGAAVPPMQGDVMLLEQAVMGAVLTLHQSLGDGLTIQLSSRYEVLTAVSATAADPPPGPYAVFTAEARRGEAAAKGEDDGEPLEPVPGDRPGAGTFPVAETVLTCVREHEAYIEKFCDSEGIGLRLFFPCERRAASRPSRAGRREVEPRRRTIYLLEPEERLRRILAAAIKAAGYQVVADSGDSAGDEKRGRSGEEADLLLLDYHAALGRKLSGPASQAGTGSRVKILYMLPPQDGTGEAGEEDTIGEGIRKPFAVRRLMEKVDAMLGGMDG